VGAQPDVAVYVREGLVPRREARGGEPERSEDVLRELPLVRLAADALRQAGEHDVVRVRVREPRAGRKEQRLGGGEADQLSGVQANPSSPWR
jgi:hypothetical protein